MVKGNDPEIILKSLSLPMKSKKEKSLHWKYTHEIYNA